MKFFAGLSLSILCVLFPVLAAEADQTPIYFAIRSDSSQGTGTLTDPYNGGVAGAPSGYASWYDANMHAITSGASGSGKEIILGPGIYQTYGDYDGCGNYGYLLQPNTTLRGAGPSLTTLQLVGYDRNGNNFFHCVVAAGQYGVPYYNTRLVTYNSVSIRDLTVDCNARNLFGGMLISQSTERFKHTIYGVALSGGNCSIQNVEVITPYGNTSSAPPGDEQWWGSGLESFAISIFDNQHLGNLTNNRIVDCSVRDCIGDYVSAITISGSGIIANNIVTGGAYVAYSAGYTQNTSIINNIAQDCRFGFRTDSGSMTNLLLRGNTFSVQQAAFALKGPTDPSFTYNNLTVIDNNFSAIGDSSQSGEKANGVIDIDMNTSSLNGLSIANNSISSTNSSYLGTYLRSGPAYQGLSLANNISSLTSSVPNTPINSGITTDATSATIEGNSLGLVDFRANNISPSSGVTAGFSAYFGSKRGGLEWQVRPGGSTTWQVTNLLYGGGLSQSISGDDFGTVCVPGRLAIGTASGASIRSGVGGPDGAEYGAAGSIYLRASSSYPTLYVKRSAEGTPWGWETVSVPAGVVVDYAGKDSSGNPTPPSGWLLCDGRSLLRSDYPQLFAAIGTTYGAIDAAHFNIPDCRGRVTAGIDVLQPDSGQYANRLTNTSTGNPGINSMALGAAGGVDRYTLTSAQVPYPTLNLTSDSHFVKTGASVGVTGGSLSFGSVQAHPIVQPTIIFQKIIKF